MLSHLTFATNGNFVDVRLNDLTMDEFKVLAEKEASIRYCVSQRTLSNLRKSGKIPYSKVWFYVGKQIRYKAQPLQNYFESNTTGF